MSQRVTDQVTDKLQELLELLFATKKTSEELKFPVSSSRDRYFPTSAGLTRDKHQRRNQIKFPHFIGNLAEKGINNQGVITG